MTKLRLTNSFPHASRALSGHSRDAQPGFVLLRFLFCNMYFSDCTTHISLILQNVFLRFLAMHNLDLWCWRTNNPSATSFATAKRFGFSNIYIFLLFCNMYFSDSVTCISLILQHIYNFSDYVCCILYSGKHVFVWFYNIYFSDPCNLCSRCTNNPSATAKAISKEQ